jgi:hypothetical protein
VGFSLAQSKSVVRIIVLPEHEKNFNALVTWLNKSDLFKNKANFIKSIQETFKYAKEGDHENYIRWLSVFKSELAKLNDVEKSELMDFTLKSLTPIKKEFLPMELPGCEANCLLTSCRTQCPENTKPKCRCEWFFADCGCEPYK